MYTTVAKRQRAMAYYTSQPTLRVAIPAGWKARDHAFSVPTMPRCLVFAASEVLPVVPAGNGEWDQPVDALSKDGIAMELSALDMWQSPAKWLQPRAVSTLKVVDEWPANPNSDLEASPKLDHRLRLSELGVDPLVIAGRSHRAGVYRVGHWAVQIDVWFGSDADLNAADEVVSSIQPS